MTALFEQLPPNDTEAEECVLAALLVEPDQVPEMGAVVRASDFFREKHAWIYAAIQHVYDRDGAAGVNQITVAHELAQRQQLDEAGGQEFFGDIIRALPTALNATWYGEIVRKAALSRAVIQKCAAIMASAYANPDDPGELIDRAVDALLGVQAAGERAEALTLAEILDRGLRERLESRMENPGRITGMPTGWPALDHMLDGLQGGRVYLVAAETSVGKSLWVQNLAHWLVNQEIPVLYFTSEMSPLAVAERLAYLDAKMDRLRIHRRGYYTPAEQNALREAQIRLEAYPLRIVHMASMNAGQIRSECRRWQARMGVAVVILDHVDHIESASTRKNSTTADDVAETTRSLQHTAVQLNIPVIAISHMNRQRDARKLSRLLNGGMKERDADAVLFLAPVRFDGPERVELSNEEASGLIKSRGWVDVMLEVAKARDGNLGNVLLRLDWWSHGGRYLEVGGEA